MTEQELEDRTTEMIDRERIKDNILRLEIETLKEAVKRVENVSGVH